MRRETRALLLVLFGACVLRISLLGTSYLRYVRESMRPYLVASGLLLVALGVTGVVLALHAQLRSRAAPGAGADGGQDGGTPEQGPARDHAQVGPRSAWLLTLPVLAVLLIAPPALGSYTAQRSESTAVEPSRAGNAAFPPLPATDPLTMTLADFTVRAVRDDSGSLAGRRVVLTGFATPAKGGGWYLTRLTISCCAADALTHKVLIRGTISAPAADTWLRVEGTWHPNGQTGREDAIPALDAKKVTRVTQPLDPYA
ncbi:TIGR03943 family putative permease subunit [Streptomyces sp. MI02-7b]|uniref:TIGR03943 family putative permease subunit n=1 Tax=Streptomyces sp. MI02-7b TaxID=462941 RepID=UPI0029BDB3D4|nr:TIGR03943 family protein [Streptomyces sp. MI02-7b]MDX3073558.1 TIGR03943 family protein [Streptomyces sp. MI02-7b]